jgi:hypothetical protein
MADQVKETPDEQRLIKDMKRRFGGSLCEFLLAGYGEDEVLFTRSFMLKETKGLKRDVSLRITTEDPEGLPNKKEPLVFLSLLSLLRKKEDVPEIDTLVMPPVSVIRRVLGWETNAETHRIIHSAIRKYYHLSYTTLVGDSQTLGVLKGYTINIRRSFVSCGYQSFSVEASEMEERICIYVEFNREIRIDITERNLFSLTWDEAMLVKGL